MSESTLTNSRSFLEKGFREAFTFERGHPGPLSLTRVLVLASVPPEDLLLRGGSSFFVKCGSTTYGCSISMLHRNATPLRLRRVTFFLVAKYAFVCIGGEFL